MRIRPRKPLFAKKVETIRIKRSCHRNDGKSGRVYCVYVAVKAWDLLAAYKENSASKHKQQEMTEAQGETLRENGIVSKEHYRP